MNNNLNTAYLNLVKTKEISLNPNQLDLVNKLDDLLTSLNNNAKRIFRKKHHNSGIYIYGDVGRGKSLIMDLFFNKSQCKKKRIHFHEMMIDIHHNLHSIRKHRVKIKNPLQEIAKNYAKQYQLICFDEFQVTDVADAMILEQLFRYFFKYNIIIVSTSNRHPDNLYKGGLQREKYLEFVDFIKSKLEIYQLKGNKDFRVEQIAHLSKTYFYPNNNYNLNKIKHICDNLTGHSKLAEHVFKNMGRNIIISEAASSTAIIDFDEFCRKNYAASDYKIICTNFSTLFFINIPQIDDRNEAKRFMSFIDIIYDLKINVIFLAETEVKQIYKERDGSFEFQRCISRIIEMQSENYINKIN
ncbi:MAG: cell division protein ZapE [Alphaproteobacteria bacterium]|jgi:cell division protein ZapE|nr:cell division protein ZapE [Alphaproteobacteria bacterium]MBT5827435.1 cell division protein ZapE [Alphaproteobacteria bacterium]